MKNRIEKPEISIASMLGHKCLFCKVISPTISCPRCGKMGKTIFGREKAKESLNRYAEFIDADNLSNGRDEELIEQFGDMALQIKSTAVKLLQATFYEKILPSILIEIASFESAYPELRRSLADFGEIIEKRLNGYESKQYCLGIFQELFKLYNGKPAIALMNTIDSKFHQFFGALSYFQDNVDRFITQVPTTNIFTDPGLTLRKHELIVLCAVISEYRPIIEKANYSQSYMPVEVI